MRSIGDVAWVACLVFVAFCVGIVYQWYFSWRPSFPFSLPGIALDGAREQAADVLRSAGFKKPDYYYSTDQSPEGILYKPDLAQPGLTLVTGVGDEDRLSARVMELDGTEIHQWDIDWFEIWPDADHLPTRFLPKQPPGANMHGVAVLGEGDLVFNFDYLGLVRLDICGDVVWRLPYQTHHSLHVDEATGHLWVSGLRFHERAVPDLPNHIPPFYEPTVLEVSPEGEILQEISVFDVLLQNDLQGLLYMQNFNDVLIGRADTTGDTLHLNDVETFPTDMEEGVFSAGDIMISLRNIHSVFVFDPQSKAIIYSNIGGFSAQHDPDFIDGNTISVFDNNFVSGDHAPQESKVVIFDALAEQSEVYYRGTEENPFYTYKMGKNQWLPNGNLLLTESTKGRAFEVDPSGDVVWQFVNLVEEPGWVGLIDEAQRLPAPYDRSFFEGKRAKCQVS